MTAPVDPKDVLAAALVDSEVAWRAHVAASSLPVLQSHGEYQARWLIENAASYGYVIVPAGGLDEAWRAAEAALPEGWCMEMGDHPTKGYWAQAIGPENDKGVHASVRSRFVFARTPAAALTALATMLQERKAGQ